MFSLAALERSQTCSQSRSRMWPNDVHRIRRGFSDIQCVLILGSNCCDRRDQTGDPVGMRATLRGIISIFPAHSNVTISSLPASLPIHIQGRRRDVPHRPASHSVAAPRLRPAVNNAIERAGSGPAERWQWKNPATVADRRMVRHRERRCATYRIAASSCAHALSFARLRARQ